MTYECHKPLEQNGKERHERGRPGLVSDVMRKGSWVHFASAKLYPEFLRA